MTPKPRLADLFCGAGGCAKGYQRAGFYVVGVDINPQPNYCGDEFHQADALAFDLTGFDAVHASPPCQAFTTMRVMPNAKEHPDLVDPTRKRLQSTGLPWAMENVPGAPLDVHPPSLLSDVSGVTLCGSMFGLNDGTYELRRHRLFESNVPIAQPSCRHRLPVVGFYGDHARTRQRTVGGHRDRGGDITGNERKLALVRDLMGIDWMQWHEANQAIPPRYTQHIGAFLLEALESPA
jgi:DNA (cytosine-5)-methyltransferase 1